MGTTSQEEQRLTSDVLSALETMDPVDAVPGRRHNRFRRWLLTALAVVILAGLAAAGFAKLAGTLGSSTGDRLLTHTVAKGELLITITEDGNLESANNKDIKCEVAGGSTILSIVEDGKLVEKGEELVRLDSSQLEEQISQQKITREKAAAAYIQAEKDYNVAVIAVKEYLEGTFRKEVQDLQAQITITLENLRSAENTLRHTERMFRKGYVSPLQRETQEFAVQRAQLELDSAQTAKEVLEKFTKAKMMEDLQSKRDIAEAKKKSEKASLELEEGRLLRLEAQLDRCVVYASQDGMAVYANQTSRRRMGSQQPQIEEGAMVREQQTLFRLPDLSQMQVKVAVHESKVDQLRPRMRARIRIQDQQYHGEVGSIANQPEAGGFFSANVKEYATVVRLDGDQKGVKPGMTAEVEILVAHLKDVLMLPVAAVVEQRGKFYCWVKRGENTERRPLVLGLSNDKFVEVTDGVTVGDEVVLNPRAVVADARDEGDEEEALDVEKNFGAASNAEQQRPGRSGDNRGGRPSSQGPRAEREPPGPPGSGHPGPATPPGTGPPRTGGQRSRGGMMQMDTDGDGKISRSEAPERMQGFFDKLDGNKDGFIDAAEINAMQQRYGQGGGRPGGGPPGSGRPGGE